jgi:hypothetical protein
MYNTSSTSNFLHGIVFTASNWNRPGIALLNGPEGVCKRSMQLVPKPATLNTQAIIQHNHTRQRIRLSKEHAHKVVHNAAS